ncbi:hypothetical protein EJD97_024172 [Solanum chilense]|uniref:Gag-pol polyprotein n=1 Tax=Solanum chilense TaxID=4083 RepID=A0A6N2C9K7_SOLCI|nr:hypothetical protein EJD97_024172 [Solanum chilense]
MNTRRMPARRLEEERVNEENLSQVEKFEQVPQHGKGIQVAQGAQLPPQGDHVSNEERCNEVPVAPLELTNQDIREAFIFIERVVPTKDSFSMVPRVMEITMTSRLRDFVKMNHPIFLVSKVCEDPHEFLDGMHKVLNSIGVTSREKAELASY